jgi:hypothetical protein
VVCFVQLTNCSFFRLQFVLLDNDGQQTKATTGRMTKRGTIGQPPHHLRHHQQQNCESDEDRKIDGTPRVTRATRTRRTMAVSQVRGPDDDNDGKGRDDGDDDRRRCHHSSTPFHCCEQLLAGWKRGVTGRE